MADNLRVRRLVAHCRVPAGAPGGRRLAAALADELAGPLERAVSAAVPDGYWLIRRIDARAHVGAGWTTGQMADAVARGIGNEVLGRARKGRDASELLWFADRETYLAGFLLDLARGRADERWEYAGFKPLRDWVSVAADLAAEPGLLEATLLRLTQAELDEVAERVPGDDLLERLLGAGPGAIAEVLEALRIERADGGPPLHGSTGLVLAMRAVRDLRADLAAVARTATDVARLLRMVGDAGARGDRVLAAVASGRWADVVAVLGPSDAFLPLVRWSSEDRTALVDAVTTTPERVPAESVHTRFGGALLLLPLLPDLWSWVDATAAWPAVDGVGPDRLARLAVLAAALGTARYPAALDDPVLRTALAVPGDVDVRMWLAGLDPGPFVAATGLTGTPVDAWFPGPGFPGVAAEALLRDLARRLPGMADASPAYLWHNVLDIDAFVRLEEHEAVVELGRAPLGVLLGITGLARTTCVVPGAGERRWTLTSRS